MTDVEYTVCAERFYGDEPEPIAAPDMTAPPHGIEEYEPDGPAEPFGAIGNCILWRRKWVRVTQAERELGDIIDRQVSQLWHTARGKK